MWFMAVQKLSALSASLARVVSTAEEEEAELDQFPVEGVRKPLISLDLQFPFYITHEFTMNKTLIIISY